MIDVCCGLACAAGARSAPRTSAKTIERMVVSLMKLLAKRGWKWECNGTASCRPATSEHRRRGGVPPLYSDQDAAAAYRVAISDQFTVFHHALRYSGRLFWYFR